MPLSKSERFTLKSRLLDAMNDGEGWDFQRRNLLLSEFGFETMDGNYEGPGFDEIISKITDDSLIEMYSLVTGIKQDDVRDSVDAPEMAAWKSGYVRMFLSHSAHHKAFVGEVAQELAVVGIHGFVAHDSMAYSKPWQAQIEQSLRSMQAFVAIVHPEFLESAWCHQEVGWALGSRVPKYVVRMGVDPTGFVGHDQWPSGHGLTAREVAGLIGAWAGSIPGIGEPMIDGLFSSLENAGNYIDAGATAERIAALDGLSVEQWRRLDEIVSKNDQVHRGALPSKALRPFYGLHQRSWPPFQRHES